MVGGRLDGLYLGGLRGTEAHHQAIEFGHGGRRKCRNLCKMRLVGKGFEPLDLNLQATADQAVFGKVLTQGINLGRIAAIERRKHRQGIARHGCNPSLRDAHCNFPAKMAANLRFPCQVVEQVEESRML